jgi:LPXTG-site transpeptidase (sortase) family protein
VCASWHTNALTSNRLTGGEGFLNATMNSAKITLDDPVFVGRLKYIRRSSSYVKRPNPGYGRVVNDIFIKPPPASVFTDRHREPQQYEYHKQQPGQARLPQHEVLNSETVKTRTRRPMQVYALYTMAAVVFLFGVVISYKGWQVNHMVAAQVDQLQKSSVLSSTSPTSSSKAAPPSSTKPQPSAIASYSVPADQPRYIDIPSLDVHARVLKVGINAAGELGTPDSVFDTAWFSGSAKPGQRGAVLIDGHVSSWTTHGVFYGLKKLKPGDTIKIQSGDGKSFQYKIVKSQVYEADKVDMNAALAPVTPNIPGLNLITCTGQVKSGTSEFNQRLVVFTQQI